MRVAGGRERVSENTIAYFAQKVLTKRLFSKKERKIEGVKGENVNILGEKTIFELTTKKESRQKFLPGRSEIFPENRKFFGWN